jgi:queuine tRNA-ribosyltransferase
MSEQFSFRLQHVDARSRARRGTFSTPHGIVETPAFMPVGTQGTVKGLEIEMLRKTGSQMILGNTYHLALRPGEGIVEKLGGLHRFMGWDGPILTDSGGFQVFSLAANVKITEERAAFRSRLDGNLVELSPERAVAIQESLGSDVAMVLDHVVALPNSPEVLRDAAIRSVRWAERAKKAHKRTDQAQFAIVQGGLDPKLRIECTEALRSLGFPGYAVGGLSVGEPPEEMYRILNETVPALPDDRPRYLMGVGRPQDILQAIELGIDLFDCVLPTRNGRNAMAFTDSGTVRVRNQKYAEDSRPLDQRCPCPACRRSVGYLRHLFMADEMLGPILLSVHNVTYFQRMMTEARGAIAEDRFIEFKLAKLQGWSAADKTPTKN